MQSNVIRDFACNAQFIFKSVHVFKNEEASFVRKK